MTGRRSVPVCVPTQERGNESNESKKSIFSYRKAPSNDQNSSFDHAPSAEGAKPYQPGSVRPRFRGILRRQALKGRDIFPRSRAPARERLKETPASRIKVPRLAQPFAETHFCKRVGKTGRGVERLTGRRSVPVCVPTQERGNESNESKKSIFSYRKAPSNDQNSSFDHAPSAEGAKPYQPGSVRPRFRGILRRQALKGRDIFPRSRAPARERLKEAPASRIKVPRLAQPFVETHSCKRMGKTGRGVELLTGRRSVPVCVPTQERGNESNESKKSIFSCRKAPSNDQNSSFDHAPSAEGAKPYQPGSVRPRGRGHP